LNARLKSSESYKEVKIITLKKILAGEEIIISYNKNAFRKDNCDYLYETNKPHLYNIIKQALYYLRFIKREIPINKSILILIKRRHKELYEWE
jgi:hypothetical protein